MDPRLAPLADTLRLNTRLFRNCLDGMTEEQARVRPSTTTNSAAFVAAHLAQSRYYLLKLIGVERECSLDQYLGWKSIEEIQQWPSLAEIQASWTEGSQALRDRLDALTAAELDAPHGTKFPIKELTVLGLIGFMVQHDSYHVGQLSLLRKYAGLPAMSYS